MKRIINMENARWGAEELIDRGMGIIMAVDQVARVYELHEDEKEEILSFLLDIHGEKI